MIQTETLDLLEWPRLCQHLATFAATKLGAIASRHLTVPKTQAESQVLLAQTQEVCQLERQIDSGWQFTGIGDIGASLARATIGGRLSAEDLLVIATTLAGVRRLRRVITTQAQQLPTLAEVVANARTYPDLEQEIHRCIDDQGQVADRASAKLTQIRQQIKCRREQIYQTLQRIMQSKGSAIQQTMIALRDERYVLPVKATHKDQIPGTVRDSSSTGSTLFIEPQSTVESSNRLTQLRRQEQVEVNAILTALSEQVATVGEDLERLLAIATTLDLATARARYSLWMNAHPPRFTTPDETMTLRQLRHPLLVWQHHHEKGPAVIPIDARISPQLRVVTLTGPNTGGKTVTLKTFGLAALMAKVGLFLPAKPPIELPWFEQILADIGDEQSLQQSLSTFSGHIRRISRIMAALVPGSLNTASTKLSASLILLDEIGAGTDPSEGSALAIALLKTLAQRAQLTIATTHYGELKALKYQDVRFENASVEFDDQTLQPTYRLLWGIPGRSNALIIAERLGLDPEIIHQAKQEVGGASADINQTIAGLEAQRREQAQKHQAAQDLLAQTEQFHAELSAKAAALTAREETLKVSQEQAVQQAITTAKAEIAQVIRQLQQGHMSAQKAQKATAALNQIAQTHLPKSKKAVPKPSHYHPKVGDKVRLLQLGQTAEILAIEGATQQLTVRLGLMKTTVPLDEIESLSGEKVTPPPKSVEVKTAPQASLASSRPTVRTSQTTVDLRGSRVADAESDLEAAITKATDDGGLWIIHGKGTGRLRQGVHDYLARHPQVARFQLAPQNEGGSGVTIVTLK